MNPKFFVLAILIVSGINLKTQAQVSYNKRVMGSLGTPPKAGDFLNDASLEEVDKATGTLKVGIPLYEIKVNDISVPITLNYTALGLKAGQEAGPAGMGWDLSAGGKIIRNVQGKVDDESGVNIMPLDILANPGSFDPYGANRIFTQDIIDGKKDGAWDTYNYILPNGGGSYVKSGATFPYDPLITIQHPGVIKTTDGLTYNFAPGEQRKITKRIYYEPNSPNPSWITSTAAQWSRDDNPTIYYDWDLSDIVSSKFKDTVTFNYEIVNNPAKLAAKTRISTSESLPLYRPVEATTSWSYSEPTLRFFKITQPIIAQSKTEVIRHTRIQSIKFPNGQVSFEYSANDITGSDVLLNITIYQIVNGVTKVLKKYEFEYDLQEITFGHYLKQINVLDSKSTKINSWSFTYNGKMPVVPRSETRAQDRWGFYNAAVTNKTLLEHPDNTLVLRNQMHLQVANVYNNNSKVLEYSRPEAVEIYGINGLSNGLYRINFANRESTNSTLDGTLSSVKVPTGATVSYEYERHRFILGTYTNSAYSNTPMTGGGIRIRTITTDLGHDSLYRFSPEGKVRKTLYEYGEGVYESSSASIEANGYGNVTIPGNVLGNNSIYYNPNSATQALNVTNMMLLSHPVNDMSQYNGSYCIYKSVTVRQGDPSGIDYNSFGKTVYYNYVPEFYDRPDNPWRPSGTMPNENYFSLPYMYINAGVKREIKVGLAGIKKYRWAESTRDFWPIEETKFYYKFFDAPITTQYQNKLLSFYGTVSGQISGPYGQTNPGVEMRDPGVLQPPGLKYLFNANRGADNGLGVMDYLAATNLAQEPNTPNFPGKYSYQLLDMAGLSNCMRKEREQTMVASDDRLTTTTDTRYYYDNLAHLMPTRIASNYSNGDSTIVRTKYAQDYPNGISAIDFMKSNRLALSEPVEEFTNYKRGTNEYVKDGTVNTFKVDNGAVFNDKVYKMSINSNLPYAGPYYSTLDTTLFKPQISYDQYLKGNIYKYTEANGSGNVVIWGYNNQYPIAKVSNVGNGGYIPSEEVAYTSFESSDRGNWVYSGNPVSDLTSPSGKRVYSLANGALSKIKPTSTPAKRYIVSYWYKTGSTVNISGATAGAAAIKNSKAGWTLAERELTALTGSIVISGTGYIDELRFHPYASQMTTYNYEPVIGLSGSIDPKGVMQFYEYDDFQRLKNVRDQDGNITKSYRYNVGTSN